MAGGRREMTTEEELRLVLNASVARARAAMPPGFDWRETRVELYRGETVGYADIMGLFRMSDTDWGDTVGMLFALAECAYVFHGETFDGFRPAPSRVVGDPDTLDRDSYPDGMVIDWCEADTVTLADMRKAYTVLMRYRDWLKAAGKDY